MFEDAWSKSYVFKDFREVVLGFWKYDRNRKSALGIYPKFMGKYSCIYYYFYNVKNVRKD